MTTNGSNVQKVWNIVLWILQVVLAGMFLMAGSMKVTKPIDELNVMMPWTTALSGILIRTIGACEILGALGLILPSLLRIKPWLTPMAATALLLVMLMAAIFHATRGEFSAIGFNTFMGIIAGLIAWGRFRKAPISAR